MFHTTAWATTWRYAARTALVLASIAAAPCTAAQTRAQQLEQATAVAGGLCVQLGADETSLPLKLAGEGRFLVCVLDKDTAAVEAARQATRQKGLYGLLSANRWTGPRLPLTEDIVNLLIVARQIEVDAAEIDRVVCPGGVVVAARPDLLRQLQALGWETARPAAGGWMARKRWPETMDEWTHPRHGADGNAVSNDEAVGPPRRIRWVVGEPAEDSRMVTAAGRNYYEAGALARDGFNGLRLWRRTVESPPRRTTSMGSVSLAQCVARGKTLVTIEREGVGLYDGQTGSLIRAMPEAGQPNEVLIDGDRLLALDDTGVRGLSLADGRQIWQAGAAEPQLAVAGDGILYYLNGSLKRGDAIELVARRIGDGALRWQRGDFAWINHVARAVYHDGLLALEISTLSDEKEGNRVAVLQASDGKLLWSREFAPGMNHRKQARAMFVGDTLWVLEVRRTVALDPRTGVEKQSCEAGYCHCFPPVATTEYLFAGEMEMTSLSSGEVDANRITKGACGRDAGWVPANGLINVFPKHCVCWPMLRGYAALAPEEAGSHTANAAAPPYLLESFAAAPGGTAANDKGDWPMYRHDPWRSGATQSEIGLPLETLWETQLDQRKLAGPIVDDWRENPFVAGPLTSPVAAGNSVFVARPDAHELVALDATNGQIRWRYTANGRIDTAPTIYAGLCLFGTKAGWVYCLDAADGKLVWRLRAAPHEEQIVAYGQLESPWPVPGSVLVAGDVAYFAAGRQALADGGIRLFAVDPRSGKVHWTQRLDSLPIKNFYASCSLEFDNFDLLQAQGDSVAMARWHFDRANGEMTCQAGEAFARIDRDEGSVIVPRSFWSYAPRQQPRHAQDKPRRALVVFDGNRVIGSTEDRHGLFARDFDLDGGEKFDMTWITGWSAATEGRKPDGLFAPNQRLAQKAAWTAPAFDEQEIAAMVEAGGRLFAASAQGGLKVFDAQSGRQVAEADLPAPVWDGMAAAGGRLLVATSDGRLMALGASAGE